MNEGMSQSQEASSSVFDFPGKQQWNTQILSALFYRFLHVCRQREGSKARNGASSNLERAEQR